ncbi:uncharacterized protein LOC143192696 [Rhynchophorus ferrugineus]|uniref:uncharacterized protein LOC143192696 n=1 Tax=Rhynchophorus ferrugineus TaxID=354439 RepID=UPI003FCE998A
MRKFPLGIIDKSKNSGKYDTISLMKAYLIKITFQREFLPQNSSECSDQQSHLQPHIPTDQTNIPTIGEPDAIEVRTERGTEPINITWSALSYETNVMDENQRSPS